MNENGTFKFKLDDEIKHFKSKDHNSPNNPNKIMHIKYNSAEETLSPTENHTNVLIDNSVKTDISERLPVGGKHWRTIVVKANSIGSKDKEIEWLIMHTYTLTKYSLLKQN